MASFIARVVAWKRGYVEVTRTNEGRASCEDPHTQLNEKCYYRPYECEYCGHKDTYTAITGETKYWSGGGHYSVCPEYPLDCPNSCGVTGIRRRAMPDHHNYCPLELLDCPFKDAGCTEKIARKDMEEHMTATHQKHILLIFQSLQRSNQQLQLLKDNIIQEIICLKGNIRHNTNTPESFAQSLSVMMSVLQGSLDKIGDTLTFRVTEFPQLRRQNKVWHSPPFSINGKARVHLAVHPGGVGRGQGSHVSMSLILEVVKSEEDMWLQYTVSVTAVGQHRSATPKTFELCTFRKGGDEIYTYAPILCSAGFPFPSPGEVLRSEELFMEIEEANSLLVNDSIILELNLLRHQCHFPWS